MSGYSDMHVSVAKSKAAANPTEQNIKDAKVAEKSFGNTPKTSPVAASKQNDLNKVKTGEQVTSLTDEELVERRNKSTGQEREDYQREINRRSKDGKTHSWTRADNQLKAQKEATKAADQKKDEVKVPDTKGDDTKVKDLSDPDPKGTKEAAVEVATSYGIGPDATQSKEALTDVVNSGAADKAKDDIVPNLTNNGKPYSKEEFENKVLPSTSPESGLTWYQQWAPLLTVLSVATTAIGMANGVMIPPINFGKITNRDEAYQSYLNIIEEDQKQRNADRNTITSPADAALYKKAYDEEQGEGAYKEGVETFGAATEAGQMAVGQQAHEQEKETMGIAQKYNLETLDKEQENTLAQMEKSNELEKKIMEIEQTYAIENMNEQNKLELAILSKQAENSIEMARVMNDLEANLDAKSIKALQDAGLSVNQYAQWMKGRSGRTTADTVNDYINSVGGVAGSVTDAFIPG